MQITTLSPVETVRSPIVATQKHSNGSIHAPSEQAGSIPSAQVDHQKTALSEAHKKMDNNALQAHQKENIAFEFERIFALQLVSQMTQGLFESTAEGPLSSPTVLHKSTINDTLATQLARQELFGFSARIRELWSENPSASNQQTE